MRDDPRRILGDDLLALATRFGPIAAATELTPVPSARTPRRSFRISYADGSIRKGRRFATPEAAAVSERIRAALAPSFLPRLLARDGGAALEEWIEGTPLARAEAKDAREAGAMLAALHRAPAPPLDGTGFRPATAEDWLAKGEREVAALAEAGLLAPGETEPLLRLLRAEAPEGGTVGVVLRDLAPENLVRRPDGALACVDAGALAVGLLEEDLARLWYRWPLGPEEQAAFLEGYGARRSAADPFDPEPFWAAVVLLGSARVRALGGVPGAEGALATLRARLLGSAPPPSRPLRSSAPAPLAWLREFFGPAYPRAGECGPGVTLRLDADERRARQERLERAEPPAPLACFTLDGEQERLPGWRHQGGAVTVRLDDARALLTVGEGVELCADGDGRALRLALLRVVRELATLHALARGALHLHGAGFAAAPGAIAILGAKRAGKTTMLLAALRAAGSGFLANDRLLLEPGGATPLLRGMATIVRIRREGLALVAGLPPPDFGAPHRYYLTLDECARGSALLGPTERDPASMSPAQLCRWTGAPMLHAAPLAAFVFPEVDAEERRFSIARLPPEEAEARLRDALFHPGLGGEAPEAFRRFAPRPGFARSSASLSGAARRIPAFSCRVGPLAYRDDALPRALVAAASEAC